MAEGVVYSFLSHPAGSLPGEVSVSAPAQDHAFLRCPRWHWTALSVGWAGNVVLLGAVVVLVVLVVQSKEPPATAPATERSRSCDTDLNATACDRSLQEFRACLKERLCEQENSSAEGSGCRVCPRHWVSYRDKCYWLSQEIKRWSTSHADCLQRRAQLMVIQDLEEMEFIQNIMQVPNQVWIGLNVTSPGRKWTWVDGSPLNQTLFPVRGLADERSCATVKKSELHSEICNTDLKWICQKAAVPI
ncbi:killer cell lectin-like receptor subfamily B member 1A [Carettochelys insculpta]|uniref:killer cell lectin-like receptor subfamily B member 1A n=1 Tax=Carettochelys insculpta TaxID=44489 RepID=UPI003EBCDE30